MWEHMEDQRGAEVHRLGAKTENEAKIVSVRPTAASPYYFGIFETPPPALFADSWIEEKRKRGLPLWASAWWEAQVHHFEIEGERHEVVKTCEQYVALLQRLLDDFQGSELAQGSK